MSFGVYIHIPYCLQRCTYCDFATYERSKILPSSQYVNLVLQEISQRRHFFGPRSLDTLYFGGGTPSLLPPSEILSLVRGLEKQGYSPQPEAEVTIEINPATIDEDKLKAYLDGGINRFSVGAQTFDDRLLKMVNREHNAKQTLETLELLSKHSLNFSFDILFALPSQTIDGVRNDLRIAMEMGAKHISPYCLTVPDGHPLSKGRAPDEEQADMFELIRGRLMENGFVPYEISNFALPGFESQHNLLYWTDKDYWGIGLSSHSYRRSDPWGVRFWNKNAIGEYQKQIEAGNEMGAPLEQTLESTQFENLQKHESLTDFCHTSLRLMNGLSASEVSKKFTPSIWSEVIKRLEKIRRSGLIEEKDGRWSLTWQGVVMSNRVFAEMVFSAADLSTPSH